MEGETPHKSLSCRYLGNKDLALSTSSPDSLQQAETWISDCLKNHAVCQLINKDLEFIPRRLIHINCQGEAPHLRLCDTSSLRKSEVHDSQSLLESQFHFQAWKNHVLQLYEEYPVSTLTESFPRRNIHCWTHGNRLLVDWFPLHHSG